METLVSILVLINLLIFLASYWLIFEKADKPGFFAFIPILNLVTMINIAGRPWWWILGFVIVPLAPFLFYYLVWSILDAFGQELWLFLVVLLLPPFAPLVIVWLGYGEATYTRPNTGVPA